LSDARLNPAVLDDKFDEFQAPCRGRWLISSAFASDHGLLSPNQLSGLPIRQVLPDIERNLRSILKSQNAPHHRNHSPVLGAMTPPTVAE